MKIKGVSAGGKGKRRGDVIEFSPEEKVPLAVKDAIRAMAPKGEVFLAGKATFKNLNTTLKSIPSRKKSFSNNAYSAEGTVSFQRHTLADDKLFPPQTVNFKIEFEDNLDSLGQPDLAVKSFVTS